MNIALTQAERIAEKVYEMGDYLIPITGICNNAAWNIAMNCHDQAKKHPLYRQQVKRAFKTVLERHKSYRLGVKYAKNELINVNQMPTQLKAKYKDGITQDEYIEIWEGYGSAAYMESQPLVSSLHHKYKKAYDRLGVKHSDILAHIMVGHTVLLIATSIYEQYLEIFETDHKVNAKYSHSVYKCLSLRPILDAWQNAMNVLDNSVYALTEEEAHNIELGVQQIWMLWCDRKLMGRSLNKVADDFEDVFRNEESINQIKDVVNIIYNH